MVRFVWDKSHLGKTALFESPPVVLIDTEPANPQYLHAFLRGAGALWTKVYHDMECHEHASIPERMLVIP